MRRGLAAAAALAATPAAAPVKATMQEARYQLSPKDGFSCSMCTLFRPPHACQLVRGYIVPQGWCRFFDMPD